MTMKTERTKSVFSGGEMRAICLSLLISHCCYSSITVSALQVQPPTKHSLFTSRSLVSPESTSTKGIKRRRQRYPSLSSSSLNARSNDFQDDGLGMASPLGVSRREVFSNSAKALFAGLSTPFLLDPADPANALLMKFPVDEPNTQPLKNRYHFLRAGYSELEDEGIYSTNPLFLTNRDNQMSDKGYQSMRPAIATLKKPSNTPTVAYHSLAANGMDTGDLIARELKLGRDRLLPEFTYLDQRGIGLWDSNEEELIRPAVWAMDKLEAGKEGFGGKPPANTDGTPNDNLHDQFTRLRQFISLQETRTAGETILVIFPDGTGPALLSCMIAGIPYSEVHALEFQPGELRLDITVTSVKELYEARKDDPAYLATIEDGKEKLRELRQMKEKDFSISFKDSKLEEKEAEISRINYEKQQAEAAERRKADEERRQRIQEEILLKKEKAKKKEEEKKQELLAIKEKKEQKLREQRELAEKRKVEQLAAYDERKRKQAEAQRAAKQNYMDSLSASQAAARETKALQMEKMAALKEQKSNSEPSESFSFGLSTPVLATAAFGALGAVFLAGSEDEDENNNHSSVTTSKDGSDGDANTAANAASISEAVKQETPKTDTTASVTSKKVEVLEETKPVLEPIHTVVIANNSATEETPETDNTVSVMSEKEEVLENTKPELEPIHSVVTTNNSAIEETPISESVQEETPEIQASPVSSDEQEDEKEEEQKETTELEGRKIPELSAAKPPPMPVPVQFKSPETKTSTQAASGNWRKRKARAPRWNRSQNKDDSTVKESSTKKEEEFEAKLEAAEQEMKDALIEAADVKKKKQQHQHQHHQPPKKKSSLFDNNPPVIVTKAKPKTTNFVYDDDEDDSAWLQVLSEIRDEEDDEEDDDFGMVDYASLLDDAQL